MTDYYVDDSGADGDGSIGTPWNNIAGHVNDLSAGDTMHVRGDAGSARVYTEAEIDITVSGSSGSRITLQPYLSELVCIKNDMGGGSHYTFDIHGAWWEIKDFEIDHNGTYAYNIYIKGNYTIIRDCEIHNSHEHNIVVASGVTDTEIRDNTMYDFILPAADAHGVMVMINADRTIVDGNTIYNCAGDAVQFNDAGWASAADNPADCEITDNTCYRGTVSRAEDGFDIKCAADLLISGNDLSDYTTETGYGILLHNQGPTDTVIKDNRIYNCRRAMILEEGTTDTEVYRNLLYDFTDEAIFISGVTNLDLWNNTIVNATKEGLRVHGNGWSGGNMKNNLWVNCGKLTLDSGVTFTATIGYNGRWDTASSAAFVDAGTDTTGNGDPGFVDAANDDYHLLSSSDCVDAGVDVGLPFYGSGPDLGYDEYLPTGPPPPPPPAVSIERSVGTSSYKIRLRSAAGVLVAEVTDFGALCYARRVNHPGLCTFTLDGDHAAIALLEHKSQVEIWRANLRQGLDWHCDFYGLHLKPDHFQPERHVFTATCPGQMWFLSTRIIAWYTATADRTAFTGDPAETIMKTLVSYNACANATTGNGRLRDGAITGLSIQADGAAGNSLDWNCAYKNLLTELQDLAQVAGGDFDLIKTAAQAWELRWYTGQRGTDRRATVIFARERGNMANPHYCHDRIGEKTVAIVGGRGEKDERDVVIRTGDDYSAGNDVEVFVDARNRSVTAGYNAAGDKRLSELRAREEFTWEVVQTPACFYGQVASGGDYELGDLTTARAFGIEKEHKIVSVTVTVVPAADSCETIDIQVETPVTAP